MDPQATGRRVRPGQWRSHGSCRDAVLLEPNPLGDGAKTLCRLSPIRSSQGRGSVVGVPATPNSDFPARRAAVVRRRAPCYRREHRLGPSREPEPLGLDVKGLRRRRACQSSAPRPKRFLHPAPWPGLRFSRRSRPRAPPRCGHVHVQIPLVILVGAAALRLRSRRCVPLSETALQS